MKVCVVIPAYNEANAIADTINEYREVFPESCIVVVDNNSTDATSENARRCLTHTDILLVERKQGKGFAVKAGLSRVDADIYILTDGDATYPALDAKRPEHGEIGYDAHLDKHNGPGLPVLFWITSGNRDGLSNQVIFPPVFG